MKAIRLVFRILLLGAFALWITSCALADSITLPANLQVIEEEAFADCESLEGVLILPPDIQVDKSAFANTPNLYVLRGVAVVGSSDNPQQSNDLDGEVWRAVSSFCASKGISCHYTTDAVSAIQSGYNVLITVGFSVSGNVANLQSEYPNVRFICLDSSVSNQLDNVYAVLYQCDQAGFMAGYTAVKKGYRSLGYMGGIPVPDVINYGQGFVLGANQAAVEMNIADQVSVAYTYTGVFIPTEAVYQTAASWYDAGVEVIFCAGGAQGSAVNEAARNKKGIMIGVDIDQRSDLSTVIYSATKNMGYSATDALSLILAGRWTSIGGTNPTLGLVNGKPANNHVGLVPASDYDADVIAKLMSDVYPSGDILIAVNEATSETDETTVTTSDELRNLGDTLTGVIHLVPDADEGIVDMDWAATLEGELRIEAGDSFFNSLRLQSDGSLTLAAGSILGTYSNWNPETGTSDSVCQVWLNGGTLDASLGAISDYSTIYICDGVCILPEGADPYIIGSAVSESSLRGFLADSRIDEIFIQGNIEPQSNVTLTVNTQIMDGCALTIPSGVTVTVGDGCILNITDGSLVVSDGGTLIVQNGGSVNGDVQVEQGGTYNTVN